MNVDLLISDIFFEIIIYYKCIWAESCASSFLTSMNDLNSEHARTSYFKTVFKLVDVEDIQYTNKDNDYKWNLFTKRNVQIKINRVLLDYFK